MKPKIESVETAVASLMRDADKLLTTAQIQRELDGFRNTIDAARDVIRTEHARNAAKQSSSEIASIAYAANQKKDPRT